MVRFQAGKGMFLICTTSGPTLGTCKEKCDKTKKGDGRKLKRRNFGNRQGDAEDWVLSDSHIVEFSTEQ